MKKSSVIVVFLLLFVLCDISAQQLFRGGEQNFQSRSGMVTPFSTQTPIDVYQQRQLFRSNINVEYHRRDNVSRPVHHNGDLVMGWQSQRAENSRLVLSNQSNGYYTQTPKSVNEAVAERVTYNSFPTINSKGEAMNSSEEGIVIETGSMQRLPEDWDDPNNPNVPVGDFLFPMLLLVGAYLSIRLFKGFNN